MSSRYFGRPEDPPELGDPTDRQSRDQQQHRRKQNELNINNFARLLLVSRIAVYQNRKR